MKKIVIIVCLFVFLLAGVAGSAFAQKSKASREMDPAEKTSRANEIYKQLPPEDQERLIEEAEYVFNYCTGRQLFASLHDCECVASNFFEERILFRPEPEQNLISIADSVAESCPNIPGVAGFAYEKCIRAYKHVIPDRLDDFCTCYANNYAKFYEGDSRAFIPHMANVGAQAILTCDKEGLPSPLNPTKK